ncbi:MAG TPA: hypothetical protein VD997_01555 [Phycisphaerales bacterium]|nr:hypothetical protein [Phycisphaerales bacterium]
MAQVIRTLPPHPVVLVMGQGERDIPGDLNGPVVVTPTCIAIGTDAEEDIEIWLAASKVELPPALRDELSQVHDGELHTPTRVVSIYDTALTALLRASVNSVRTRVRVLTSGTQPTHVAVIVSAPPHA